MLWSQPWLLIVLAIMVSRRTFLPRSDNQDNDCAQRLAAFLVPGFVLLLWMNVSFGQWHGGSSPGPRYLCSVFPAFGLLAGLLLGELSSVLRRVSVGAVAFSAAFWILVYSTHILVPTNDTMRGFTLRSLLNSAWYSSLIRLMALTLVFEWQLVRIWREFDTKTLRQAGT